MKLLSRLGTGLIASLAVGFTLAPAADAAPAAPTYSCSSLTAEAAPYLGWHVSGWCSGPQDTTVNSYRTISDGSQTWGCRMWVYDFPLSGMTAGYACERIA
ncbi:hypothetical protein AB0F77_37400 [Streptomyces sp. NPDC026672]|uniref:hypothetical protein n=1 Tax=unclassified Streptomyces TaxID=2593676 RepID=UPI0033D6AA5E